VLPTVVKRLLERRREVKKQMKTERSEAKQKQLDIRQKVRCNLPQIRARHAVFRLYAHRAALRVALCAGPEAGC